MSEQTHQLAGRCTGPAAGIPAPAGTPIEHSTDADQHGVPGARSSQVRFEYLPELAIGVLAFALYLPIAARVLILGPDVVEYLDIGRRLAAGDGFLLGVKAFHFGGTDVLHNGLSERPPLFPVLIAGLFLLGFEAVAAQVMNAALTGLAVTLVALIGRQLFGREVGLLAGVLALFSPLVVERMIWPMTEALAVSLSLLATWLMMRAADRPNVRMFGLAGVVLGLAYLTRPTVLALIAVLALVSLVVARDRRAAVWPLVAYAGGVALSFMPISVYSLIQRGSWSYSGQTYLYALYKDPEVMEYGFNAVLPTPGQFIAANTGLVIQTIGETFWAYGHLLFAEWELMLPLALGWPLVVWSLARGRYPRAAAVPLVVAVTNFVVYGLTWSTFQDRYLLLTMLILLPFVVDGLRQLRLDRIPLGPVGRRFGSGDLRLGSTHLVVVLTLVVWAPHLFRQYDGDFRYGELPVGTRKDEGLVWTSPPRWLKDGDLPRLVNWINTRAEPLAVVAHPQPWPYTFFTGRPSTLLPLNLSNARLREFIEVYSVDYVLLDGRDRERRRYADALEELEEDGVSDTTLGAYRIFDVRSLHR